MTGFYENLVLEGLGVKQQFWSVRSLKGQDILCHLPLKVVN